MARMFLVWLILASTIGWGVYQLKYEVVKLDRKLARLNRDILEDQEAIHILKAEWSYLNQPAQIETASRRFLDMTPIQGKQMLSSVSALPMRSEVPQAKPDATKPDPKADPKALANGPRRGAPPAPPAKAPPPKPAAPDMDDEAPSSGIPLDDEGTLPQDPPPTTTGPKNPATLTMVKQGNGPASSHSRVPR